FDVAEDRKSEGANACTDAAELRYRQVKAVLAEGNIQVGREVRERIGAGWPLQANDRTLPARLEYLSRHEVGRADRAVFNIHLEVDADPFKEVVVQADEADFNRHLQVLQTTELLQQVGNLFMHSLRLADNQAQVRGERTNFSFAAAVFCP